MCYTTPMIKYITLIALLLPFPALSHEWGQDQWLLRLLDNHINIADCWKTLNDGDTITFRDKCSPAIMGHIENKEVAEYYAARRRHPALSNIEFLTLHFPDVEEVTILGIWENIEVVDRVHALIVGMHIAEGLTRNDK